MLNAQNEAAKDTGYIIVPVSVVFYEQVMPADFISRNFRISSYDFETVKIPWFGDSIQSHPLIERKTFMERDSFFIKFKKTDVFDKFFMINIDSKETFEKHGGYARFGNVICKIDDRRKPTYSLELRISKAKRKNEILCTWSFICMFNENEKREGVMHVPGIIISVSPTLKKKHLGKRIRSEIEKIEKASKKMTSKHNKTPERIVINLTPAVSVKRPLT
jgi:hypothetical protein